MTWRYPNIFFTQSRKSVMNRIHLKKTRKRLFLLPWMTCPSERGNISQCCHMDTISLIPPGLQLSHLLHIIYEYILNIKYKHLTQTIHLTCQTQASLFFLLVCLCLVVFSKYDNILVSSVYFAYRCLQSLFLFFFFLLYT